MAQAANVVIADGAAVNVTFSPESVTPALTGFVDRTSGVAVRFRRLSVRYNANSKGVVTSLKVAIPIWGTLPSGADGVVRTLRGTVELELPDGCTDAERKDLFAFVSNGLGNTLVRGALRDLDPLY